MKPAFRAAAILGYTACGLLADIIPTLFGSLNTGRGTIIYMYEANLMAGQRLDPATGADHFFVLVDFWGFIPGSQSINPDFVAGDAMLGPYPLSIGPDFDNPFVPNLFWKWAPGAFVVGPGPLSLGIFSAETIDDPHRLHRKTPYFGQATKHAPGAPEDGAVTANTGSVVVPGQGGDVFTAEPSSVLLIAGGFAALAYLRSRQASSSWPA